MSGALYRIVEWEQYQHYRDRSPPWIKLHRSILTSRTWVLLDDASRVLAVACMLIAADTANQIPADPTYIRRRAYLDHDPDFAPLVAVGFIEVSNLKVLAENRKQVLAPRKQVLANACSESESESESEGEGESEDKDNNAASTPRVAERRGSRLPDDWQPSAGDLAFASDLGLDPQLTADEFRDFWTALPGARGRKLDWSKTFKNRCRELGKRPHAAGRSEARQDQRSRDIRAAIERSKNQ